MRTPSKTDKLNAGIWLIRAQRELEKNEYHRVKLLCKQIIRVLRRKEYEIESTEKQE